MDFICKDADGGGYARKDDLTLSTDHMSGNRSVLDVFFAGGGEVHYQIIGDDRTYFIAYFTGSGDCSSRGECFSVINKPPGYAEKIVDG